MVKLQAPSVVPPRCNVTEPLSPTGNSADAIPGAASTSVAGAGRPDTLSLRSNRSGAP